MIIHDLFNNVYWKFVLILILSLLITFSNDINALQDGVVCYMILVVLGMLIWTKEDIGLIMLVGVLFVLSYNNVVHKKKQMI